MNRNNQNKDQKVDKACYFCKNNVLHIDYKDEKLLKRFISSYSKIVSRRRSGVCTKHQRKLANEIKKARVMAILPFIPLNLAK